MFVLSCRTKNRSFPIGDPQGLLQELLKYGREISLEQGTKYFRARIHDNPDNYDKTKPLDYKCAQPPQTQNNLGGRFNPPGFSYLYLSNDEKTAIYEAKPHRFSYVTVFEGTLTKSIKVVDFSDFIPQLNLALVNANLKLKEENELRGFIAFLVSLPVEPSLRNIMYSSTQYMADFIKSKGHGGICYISSLKSDGKNFVIFEKDAVNFENGNRTVSLIKEISYEYDQIITKDNANLNKVGLV